MPYWLKTRMQYLYLSMPAKLLRLLLPLLLLLLSVTLAVSFAVAVPS